MAFPNTSDSFTPPSGTSTLTSPDHADLHARAGSAITNIESFLGTNSAINVFVGFNSGDHAAKRNFETFGSPTVNAPQINGGTITGQIKTSGTFANGVYGTATYQGGTIANAVIGTSQITGGTVGSITVLQPLQSAFWALPNAAGTSTQVLGTNQVTQIVFPVVTYDLLSEFGTATNNFIAKQAGLYQFGFQSMFLGAATGIEAGIRLNGTFQQTQAIVANGNFPFNITWQGSVSVGGTVDVAVFNNSASTPGTINQSQVTTSFYGKRVF